MMREFATFLVLATSFVILAAEPDIEIVLTGLSVIDVETGEVRASQTVTIRDGLIESVKPDATVSSLRSSNTVTHDLSGRFAIPGLWDMHVHLRGGPELEADNRLWLRQYLGFGVTTIRDAGGDVPDEILSWKEAIAAHSLPGPRILSSLRKVDGAPSFRRGSVEIESEDEVLPALQGLRSAGADFIKVNDGRFPDSTFLEILRQAEELGMETAAHIPLTVTIDDLSKSGLGSIEHAYFLTKFASADEQQLIEKLNNKPQGDDPFSDYYGAYSEFAVSIDEAKASHAFRVMSNSDIAVTPTLYLLRRWFTVDESTSAEDEPRYFETPASILQTHDAPGWIQYMNQRSPKRTAADVRMITEAQSLVGLAAEQGVTILAGSDTGTTNTFMYAGDSLHHELVELVRAGLSPLQALRAASIDAAGWFDLEEEAGSIEAGKWADLVILDKNPLEDIRNTRTIAAVIQLGRFYNRAELERLKRLPENN